MFCRSSLHGLAMLETSMQLVALDTIDLKVKILYHLFKKSRTI